MIPYGRQSIDEADIQAVADVLRGDLLTGGPAVAKFEAALSRATGAPYVSACANGTAALHLAMLALDVGPGDAVIVPSMTFLASANAAVYVGAHVRFADVNADTGLLTPETLRAALARSDPGTPKVVVVVHLNGRSADVETLASVAAEYGCVLIEDACHALGGTQQIAGRPQPVGSAHASAMACFSFHPVKTIAMGEGGAVTSRDATLIERVNRLRNHGMVRDAQWFAERGQAFADDGQPNPWYYEMPEPGFNYRASDIHCALGTSQLAKLDSFIARRRALAEHYDERLIDLAPLIRPVPPGNRSSHGLHLYAVLIDFARARRTRAQVMHDLRARGVGTQVHYLPVHRQPFYRQTNPGLMLAGSDAYYQRCLSLPLFPDMTSRNVDEVVSALKHVLASELV